MSARDRTPVPVPSPTFAPVPLATAPPPWLRSQPRSIVGLVGSYRKQGNIDQAVSQILAAAQSQGATTQKLYLTDYHLQFCTNCRVCLRTPGPARGSCVVDDDLEQLLQTLERADALVLGAPVNFGNLNALTRLFLERCIGYAYWPSDQVAPQLRRSQPHKTAILVTASAAPGWLARWFTGARSALVDLAKLLGAKPIGLLWLGFVSAQGGDLADRHQRQATALGHKLAKMPLP